MWSQSVKPWIFFYEMHIFTKNIMGNMVRSNLCFHPYISVSFLRASYWLCSTNAMYEGLHAVLLCDKLIHKNSRRFSAIGSGPYLGKK